MEDRRLLIEREERPSEERALEKLSDAAGRSRDDVDVGKTAFVESLSLDGI